jgi:hypothetical protein
VEIAPVREKTARKRDENKEWRKGDSEQESMKTALNFTNGVMGKLTAHIVCYSYAPSRMEIPADDRSSVGIPLSLSSPPRSHEVTHEPSTPFYHNVSTSYSSSPLPLFPCFYPHVNL